MAVREDVGEDVRIGASLYSKFGLGGRRELFGETEVRGRRLYTGP